MRIVTWAETELEAQHSAGRNATNAKYKITFTLELNALVYIGQSYKVARLAHLHMSFANHTYIQ